VRWPAGTSASAWSLAASSLLCPLFLRVAPPAFRETVVYELAEGSYVRIAKQAVACLAIAVAVAPAAKMPREARWVWALEGRYGGQCAPSGALEKRVDRAEVGAALQERRGGLEIFLMPTGLLRGVTPLSRDVAPAAGGR
jgi:hypothetical protein